MWGVSLSSSTRLLESWNRKLHFYLGLYFLFFLWVFSLTGLMLNHGQWLVSLAANARVETRYDRAIALPVGSTDIGRVRDAMRQLGLVGEIDGVSEQLGVLQFSVSRPSDANQVKVNLAELHAYVQHFKNGHLARFRSLHTFSGSRYDQPASGRDWGLTTVWVLAMDALATGVIVMILGSYLMWWRLKGRRRLGLVVLFVGVATCSWFVSGWF